MPVRFSTHGPAIKCSIAKESSVFFFMKGYSRKDLVNFVLQFYKKRKRTSESSGKSSNLFTYHPSQNWVYMDGWRRPGINTHHSSWEMVSNCRCGGWDECLIPAPFKLHKDRCRARLRRSALAHLDFVFSFESQDIPSNILRLWFLFENFVPVGFRRSELVDPCHNERKWMELFEARDWSRLGKRR